MTLHADTVSANPALTNIRDAQHAAWNHFAGGWRRWDGFTMAFLEQQRQAILDELQLQPDHAVLDVATGTGEPGLSIAERVPNGHVLATDLSEGMLETAAAKAKAKGLTNFMTAPADACELPFFNSAFDIVTCRLGFMFFPDVALAASEMARVLKPGGQLVATVWGGPSGNPWLTKLVTVMNDHLDLPAPPANGPGMFRCAEPGYVASLLEHSGMEVTREIPLVGTMRCNSAEQYWGFMNEVVPPVVAALKNRDAAQVQAIKDEVVAFIQQAMDGSGGIGYQARLVAARKR